MGKIRMMYKKSFILCASAILFLLSSPLSASVYKWVDESGQVHYGERPGNTEAEKVTIRQNETTKPRIIKSDKENTDSDKEQKAEEPAKPKHSKKQQRQYCNEAKSDLATINNHGRLREIDEKGEYTFLSEEQRQQRIATAQKKAGDFCR